MQKLQEDPKWKALRNKLYVLESRVEIHREVVEHSLGHYDETVEHMNTLLD